MRVLMQRLIRLEKAWQQDPVSLRKRANQIEAQRGQKVLSAICDAFPHDSCLEMLEMLQATLFTAPQGTVNCLKMLAERVEDGSWQSVMLPAAVVDIILHDPDARPDLICRECRIIVPTRFSASKKVRCDDYFRLCPGCGADSLGYIKQSTKRAVIQMTERRN